MPQQNDIGAILRLTITKESDGEALDISSATTRQIIIEKPSAGIAVTKTATLTGAGTDGKMQYTVESGVFNEVGYYAIQGRVVIGSQDLRTTKGYFEVESILE